MTTNLVNVTLHVNFFLYFKVSQCAYIPEKGDSCSSNKCFLESGVQPEQLHHWTAAEEKSCPVSTFQVYYLSPSLAEMDYNMRIQPTNTVLW